MKGIPTVPTGASKASESYLSCLGALVVLQWFVHRACSLCPLYRHRQIRFTVLKLPKVQVGGRFPTIHVRFLVDQRGGHIDAMFSGIQFLKKYAILFIWFVYSCTCILFYFILYVQPRHDRSIKLYRGQWLDKVWLFHSASAGPPVICRTKHVSSGNVGLLDLNAFV